MKQKISGFILAFMLLICIAVPAAAATQGYKFGQKTVSLQVGKSKSLIAYNNGRKVNPGKIRWKSSNPNKRYSYCKKLGHCQDFRCLRRKNYLLYRVCI